MSYRTWTRIALGYLTLVCLVVGMWALFAPRSFYDDFPGFGRAWVSVDGPFNEHLVRDVGGLNIALAVVLIAAIVTLSRAMVIVGAIASLASGVPHLVYHLFNTDDLGTGDVLASVGGLAAFAAVAVALIVVSHRHLRETGQ